MKKVTSSAGTDSHHLVSVVAHLHFTVSLKLFPYRLLSISQMQEMKRIGGVTFECGNALAKIATSINTPADVQFSHTHIYIRILGFNI